MMTMMNKNMNQNVRFIDIILTSVTETYRITVALLLLLIY